MYRSQSTPQCTPQEYKIGRRDVVLFYDLYKNSVLELLVFYDGIKIEVHIEVCVFMRGGRSSVSLHSVQEASANAHMKAMSKVSPGLILTVVDNLVSFFKANQLRACKLIRLDKAV